jgi:hypothetical protein
MYEIYGIVPVKFYMGNMITRNLECLEDPGTTTRITAIGSTATRSALNMWCAAGIYS